MRIGGFQKFSLIDYPGKVAAVIFTQGCDFRCPFCHNRDLVLPEKHIPPLDEEEILAFLDKRRGQLGGVTVTGGEPTVHKDLADFLRKIKDLGYSLKLDTNGNNPKALKDLIAQGLLDYIAMDIKTSFRRYQEAAGVEVCIRNIEESIALIVSSGIEHQFRTTLVHKFINDNDLESICSALKGAQRYILQKFDTVNPLVNESLKDIRTYSDEEFRSLQQKWERRP